MSDPFGLLRSGLLSALLIGFAVAVAPDAGAQAPEGAASERASSDLRVHAQVLRHRSATDAAELVRPLLSARGTVAAQGASRAKGVIPLCTRSQ